MRLDHEPTDELIVPADELDTLDGAGRVRCRVCGAWWPTTPAQDELLRQLFEHDETHDEPAP